MNEYVWVSLAEYFVHNVWLISVTSLNIFIPQSMVLSPGQQKTCRSILTRWSQALGKLLVFSGRALRMPNVLQHMGQHCTTKNELSRPCSRACTRVCTGTQVPMAPPLGIIAVFQIFIKLVISSYIILVPYLRNAFDCWFLFCVYLLARICLKL